MISGHGKGRIRTSHAPYRHGHALETIYDYNRVQYGPGAKKSTQAPAVNHIDHSAR